MTILTAGSIEKKDKKLLCHDVEASGLETAFAPLQPQPATRVEPCAFWFCLKIVIYCLMGATVITLSLVIKSLYSDGGRTFCGTLNIPYDRLVDMDAENRLYGAQQQDALTEILLRSSQLSDSLNDDGNFPHEFELDLSDDESYSKVTVPEFKDGRSGRFLHDFKYNQSLIMDTLKQRCFVMPLDRNTVLQPKSMYDLFDKMVSGYYNIDTQIVKKNMRVVVPPLTDLSDVAPRIVNECTEYHIFKLEKLQTGVFKRSISDNRDVYRSFHGNRIVQFDIINADETAAYADKQITAQ